jgi:hypothetical protein
MALEKNSTRAKIQWKFEKQPNQITSITFRKRKNQINHPNQYEAAKELSVAK